MHTALTITSPASSILDGEPLQAVLRPFSEPEPTQNFGLQVRLTLMLLALGSQLGVGTVRIPFENGGRDGT